MDPTTPRPALNQSLGTWQLWGIAVGLVISGEYFGWSYGWASAGTLGFLITASFIALMYATFIFSFTELTTSIPHAGGPFEYSRRAFGRIAQQSPVGGAHPRKPRSAQRQRKERESRTVAGTDGGGWGGDHRRRDHRR